MKTYNTPRNIQQDICNLRDAIDHHIAYENSWDLSVVEVRELTDDIKSLKHDGMAVRVCNQIIYCCPVKYFVNMLLHYLLLCSGMVITQIIS